MKYGIIGDVERTTVINALESAKRALRDHDNEGVLKGINFAIHGIQNGHYPVKLEQYMIPQADGKTDEIMAAMKAIVETAKLQDCKVLIVTKRLTADEQQEIEDDDISGL
jgi:hypothetical protein